MLSFCLEINKDNKKKKKELKKKEYVKYPKLHGIYKIHSKQIFKMFTVILYFSQQYVNTEVIDYLKSTSEEHFHFFILHTDKNYLRYLDNKSIWSRIR